VRSWTHLERQRGASASSAAPAKRSWKPTAHDRGAARKIETELVKVKRTRELHRESRRRVPYPIAALVGYTNAGNRPCSIG